MATFGKTDVGAARDDNQGWTKAKPYVVAVGGTITKLTFYLCNNGLGGGALGNNNVYVGMYDNNAGDAEPENLLFSSGALNFNGQAEGWKDYTLPASYEFTAGTYWLGQYWDNTACCFVRGDDGNDTQGWRVANFPNPFGVHDFNSTQDWSLYATYTPTTSGPKKGSSVPSTMMQMLQSKMLYSACNPFKLKV